MASEERLTHVRSQPALMVNENRNLKVLITVQLSKKQKQWLVNYLRTTTAFEVHESGSHIITHSS